MSQIVFLGTAGARVVVFKQLRSSGGIWFHLGETDILVDPGPGSLVKCLSRKEKLDPQTLAGIVLTHRHLDHSADVNVMIEAMTGGGVHARGILLAPRDCFEDDPVVLKYLRGFLERIVYLEEGGSYRIGGVDLSTPLGHEHGKVETYGLVFKHDGYSIGYITDTKYFPGLLEAYRTDILILSVVSRRPSRYDHLDLDTSKGLIREIRPKLAILTHFGTTMLREDLKKVSQDLTRDLGTEVICARDGLTINVEEKLTIPR